ncbi:MAG TPA: hypothetical protein PLZ35_10460 [Chitinophagales bacterium]|nr:hypothetical protein [Chitinophagales bacterium]
MTAYNKSGNGIYIKGHVISSFKGMTVLYVFANEVKQYLVKRDCFKHRNDIVFYHLNSANEEYSLDNCTENSIYKDDKIELSVREQFYMNLHIS